MDLVTKSKRGKDDMNRNLLDNLTVLYLVKDSRLVGMFLERFAKISRNHSLGCK